MRSRESTRETSETKVTGEREEHSLRGREHETKSITPQPLPVSMGCGPNLPIKHVP
jgi:hypothetical protein